MADNFPISIPVNLKSNKIRIASDETSGVHTLRTDMSVGGTPIDGDNPLPVSDAATLAQVIASNTALSLEIQRLNLTLIECIETPMRQIISHLEEITGEQFSLEDTEE